MKERNNNKQRVEKWDGESLIQRRPDRKHLGPGAAAISHALTATDSKPARIKPENSIRARERTSQKGEYSEFLFPYSSQELLFLGVPRQPPTPPTEKTKVLPADGIYPPR